MSINDGCDLCDQCDENRNDLVCSLSGCHAELHAQDDSRNDWCRGKCELDGRVATNFCCIRRNYFHSLPDKLHRPDTHVIHRYEFHLRGTRSGHKTHCCGRRDHGLARRGYQHEHPHLRAHENLLVHWLGMKLRIQ